MTVRRYTLKPSVREPTYRLDYASMLNPEQLAVVEAPGGPVLVIAGAGSGKTRTLIFRLARMLESGIPPERIVLLTFTNRAAREMLRRAEALVADLGGIDVRRIEGGTFHHVGARILREYAGLLGYGEGFGILDRQDQKELFASCVTELGLGTDPNEKRFPAADVLVNLYSTAVNTQRDLADVILERKADFADRTRAILRVARRYVERKLELDVMDFDDLLFQWKRLLVEEPRVRAQLQDRFRCILVDEYQDTNRLQAEIVDLLAAQHRNLTVVGDDAQSIYSFRGASFANILEFPARFPGCSIHKLTANYRSTPEILRLANASIACNRRQYPKELRAERPAGGQLPALVAANDATQQAAFIAQRILELRDEGIPLEEMAVLFRAHAHALEIELELTRRGIPYRVRGGTRFLEQAHIRDVLAILRVVDNPKDELAFKRMVRLYPGIGGRTAAILWEAFRAAWERRSRGTDDEPSTAVVAGRFSHLGEALVAPPEGLPRRAHAGWARCAELLSTLGEPAVLQAPADAIHTILARGYQARLEAEDVRAQAKLEDLRQLADHALSYPDLRTFLSELALLEGLSGENVEAGGEPDEAIVLSTVHQAKGLEWRVVFLIWLSEGSFPVSMALDSLESEEEERRCFYVALTRARDELYLSYPILAAPRDRERRILKPSRFVAELEAEGVRLYEKWILDEEPPAVEAPPSRAELAAYSRLLLGEGEEGDP